MTMLRSTDSVMTASLVAERSPATALYGAGRDGLARIAHDGVHQQFARHAVTVRSLRSVWIIRDTIVPPDIEQLPAAQDTAPPSVIAGKYGIPEDATPARRSHRRSGTRVPYA